MRSVRVEQVEVFTGVEPQVIAELVASGRDVTVKTGEPVVGLTESFGLACVLSGAVKVSCHASTGDLVMVRLVTQASAVMGAGDATDVVALEPTRALVLSKLAVTTALGRSHRFAVNVVQAMHEALAQTEARTRSFAFHDVEGRLAGLLLDFVERRGQPTPDGVLIDLALTQDALADMLGTARRSVTRAVQRWSREGALKKSRGRFIVDESRLRPLVRHP